MRAYDRLGTFNPDYRFKTWLLAIANNLGVDTLERRREIVEFNESHAPSHESPEAEAVDADRSRSVREAIATLPETYGVPADPAHRGPELRGDSRGALHLGARGEEQALPRPQHARRGWKRRGREREGARPRPCDPEPVFELADGSLGRSEREIRAHLRIAGLPDSVRVAAQRFPRLPGVRGDRLGVPERGDGAADPVYKGKAPLGRARRSPAADDLGAMIFSVRTFAVLFSTR